MSAFALALAFILTLLMSVCHRLLALDRMSTGVKSALVALLCIVREKGGKKHKWFLDIHSLCAAQFKKRSETEKATHLIDVFWESMSPKTWKAF